ncbi:N-acetyltransferase [Chitinophaga alhagiae]|uniref:N-acetyltransferase n=1 Tax=Chitinophaga alhagiae TaxID=2203219 RepID=A0ABM6WAN7_9BACT|nr:GNAT family N-acetyltransferase [Chitinophaga alhagiae]AWO00999.1 N-acetyltransferase [Chitinophaga alhagiae]
MENVPFNIINNTANQQLEVQLNGETAVLTYRFYKKNIALMHTTVPEGLKGRGIASALARRAFAYAEELKRPVMVYCPFVAKFIQEHPEYRSQLDPSLYRK